MSDAQERHRPSLVLVGSFRPHLYQPHWLVRNDLLGTETAAKTDFAVLVSEVATYTAGDILLNSTQGRLEVQAKNEAAAPLARDLCIGIAKADTEVEVRAAGINRMVEIEMATEEQWHEVGDSLVRKSIWTNIVKPDDETRPSPGMLGLSIQARRPESPALYLRVEVAGRENKKLVININEHYLSQGNKDGFLTTIGQEWAASQRFSESLPGQIIGNCLQRGGEHD